MSAVRREELIMDLIRRLPLCSLDEARVLDVQLSRIELGRDQYGPLDVSKPRDWAKEAAEERVDAAFYDACLLIAERDRNLEITVEHPKLKRKTITVPPMPADKTVVVSMDEIDDRFDHGGEP